MSLAIIYILPDFFSKYELEHEKTEYYGMSDYIYLSDLDGDSISERIIVRKNSQNKASYLIHNANDKVIDQFNFDSFFSNRRLVVGVLDLDKDGYRELYNLTYRKDSIFLNVLEPLQKNGFNKEIFVDILPKFDGEDLSETNEVRNKQFHLQKQKNKMPRLVFECVTGFLQYPRNIYAYDFELDSILSSEHLVNPVQINQVIDVDNDGNDEILISASSADNTLDPVFTLRSDSSSWLNVLDDDLTFLFPPIEYNHLGSSTMVYYTKLNSQSTILAMVKPRHTNKHQSFFEYFDLKGNLIEKGVSEVNWNYILTNETQELELYDWNLGKYGIFNPSNGATNNKWFQKRIVPQYLDADEDGKMELVGINKPNRTLTIYRNALKDSTYTILPNKFDINPYRLGMFTDQSKNSKIWIQNKNELYTYDYRKNPLYLLKYPIYLGVYLAVLALVWLIMKAQSLQEERKRKIEAQIAELQMKTIKNQLDPHFVFNAMNTISEMTLTNNRLEADKYITAFSSLMRKTLKGSDKIAHTLKEELAYIENYIQLQQIRLQDAFDFELDIEKTVDTNELVPKHVLYTYVENAIKHGLALKGNKGKLWVKGKKIPKGIQLTVADNGGGGGNSKTKPVHGTGSGLRIMEQVFKLYQERFKKNIDLSILAHQSTSGEGLAVTISIQS